MRFLNHQVIEFSHHIRETKCFEFLCVFWGLAKFSFLEYLPSSKERHMIVYMIVESRVPPCYMYIHEDALPSFKAIGLAT